MAGLKNIRSKIRYRESFAFPAFQEFQVSPSYLYYCPYSFYGYGPSYELGTKDNPVPQITFLKTIYRLWLWPLVTAKDTIFDLYVIYFCASFIMPHLQTLKDITHLLIMGILFAPTILHALLSWIGTRGLKRRQIMQPRPRKERYEFMINHGMTEGQLIAQDALRHVDYMCVLLYKSLRQPWWYLATGLLAALLLLGASSYLLLQAVTYQHIFNVFFGFFIITYMLFLLWVKREAIRLDVRPFSEYGRKAYEKRDNNVSAM